MLYLVLSQLLERSFEYLSYLVFRSRHIGRSKHGEVMVGSEKREIMMCPKANSRGMLFAMQAS
jgi:hypothetical protein